MLRSPEFHTYTDRLSAVLFDGRSTTPSAVVS
jgi:hypothetical protein